VALLDVDTTTLESGGEVGKVGDNGWEWRGTTWFGARWRRQRAATSSTTAVLLRYSGEKKGKKEKRE
jgi:hypothetical protein